VEVDYNQEKEKQVSKDEQNDNLNKYLESHMDKEWI
jgi:hypothetical protein